MEIHQGNSDAVTERLDRIGAGMIEAGEQAAKDEGAAEEMKSTRLIILLLDTPTDRATIVTGNYESTAEAAKDVELLVPALKLDA